MTTSLQDERVERVARAICACSQGHDGSWREWVEEARAAIATLSPYPTMERLKAAISKGDELADALEMRRDGGQHANEERLLAEWDEISFADPILSPAQADAASLPLVDERLADLPDEFEAWWQTSTYKNRDQIGYSLKKCLAFAAYQAGRALTATKPSGQVEREQPAIELNEYAKRGELPPYKVAALSTQVQTVGGE